MKDGKIDECYGTLEFFERLLSTESREGRRYRKLVVARNVWCDLFWELKDRLGTKVETGVDVEEPIIISHMAAFVVVIVPADLPEQHYSLR